MHGIVAAIIQAGITMTLKFLFAFFLATSCATAYAQDEDFDKKGQDNCQRLAKQLNQSKQLGIRPQGMTSLATWRAACAERPPTGPGNVTALCEGTRVTNKGEERVFFWEKSSKGKLNNGYFACGA